MGILLTNSGALYIMFFSSVVANNSGQSFSLKELWNIFLLPRTDFASSVQNQFFSVLFKTICFAEEIKSGLQLNSSGVLSQNCKATMCSKHFKPWSFFLLLNGGFDDIKLKKKGHLSVPNACLTD